MRVVVDKNNPLVAEAFEQFGDVRALSTREITRESVHDADILIVRSETKVTKELLEGSSVRFVGTATIGTDHVDTDYLASHGIGFASAPGSNANSVAEYMVGALLTVAHRKGTTLEGETLGVVGVGNVGSKVVRNAHALGMTVLQNDPPLARSSGDSKFLPLDALMDTDYLTLHVPLKKGGSDPTFHLVDAARIAKMKKGSFLINTARGAVVDGPALKGALKRGHLGGAVLDVWEGEPMIDVELLHSVDLGTPHIAGYSFDGKLKAVTMMAAAAAAFFGKPERWTPEKFVPKAPVEHIAVSASGEGREELLLRILRRCYDIEHDDRRLREIVTIPENERKAFFARLRAEYGVRREFQNTTVEIPDSMRALKDPLAAIGFKVELKN